MIGLKWKRIRKDGKTVHVCRKATGMYVVRRYSDTIYEGVKLPKGSSPFAEGGHLVWRSYASPWACHEACLRDAGVAEAKAGYARPMVLAVIAVLGLLVMGQTTPDCGSSITRRGPRWVEEPQGFGTSVKHDYRRITDQESFGRPLPNGVSAFYIGPDDRLFVFDHLPIEEHPFYQYYIVDQGLQRAPYHDAPTEVMEEFALYDGAQDYTPVELGRFPPPAEGAYVQPMGAASIEIPYELILESTLAAFRESGKDFEGYIEREDERAFWIFDGGVDLSTNGTDNEPTEIYLVTRPMNGDYTAVSPESEIHTGFCMVSHWTVNSTDVRYNLTNVEIDGADGVLEFFEATAAWFIGGILEIFNIAECPGGRHMTVTYCGNFYAEDGGLAYNVWDELTTVNLGSWPKINFICNKVVRGQFETKFEEGLNATVPVSVRMSSTALADRVPFPIKGFHCLGNSCRATVAWTEDEVEPAMCLAGMCQPGGLVVPGDYAKRQTNKPFILDGWRPGGRRWIDLFDEESF